jgi:hypothetical protein
VKITVQYFDSCPNWRLADERVRTAIGRLGLTSTELAYELIDTSEKAEASGFHGSPTILVDGRDPFANPTNPVGLSCRLFATPEGLAGTPTVDQLVRVIEAATEATRIGGA